MDWATSSRDEMAGYRRRNPLTRRVMLGLLLLWLLLVVGRALVAVTEGRWGAAVRQLVLLTASVGPAALFSWRQRRAVELDQDEPATA